MLLYVQDNRSWHFNFNTFVNLVTLQTITRNCITSIR